VGPSGVVVNLEGIIEAEEMDSGPAPAGLSVIALTNLFQPVSFL
jgi:hypothetical protein